MDEGRAVAYDPETAAILRERLAMGPLLDGSGQLSFLQRATLRMELLGISNDFYQRRGTPESILIDLSRLLGRVTEVATPSLTPSKEMHAVT